MESSLQISSKTSRAFFAVPRLSRCQLAFEQLSKTTLRSLTPAWNSCALALSALASLTIEKLAALWLKQRRQNSWTSSWRSFSWVL